MEQSAGRHVRSGRDAIPLCEELANKFLEKTIAVMFSADIVSALFFEKWIDRKILGAGKNEKKIGFSKKAIAIKPACSKFIHCSLRD
jgi:hypothetical protein